MLQTSQPGWGDWHFHRYGDLKQSLLKLEGSFLVEDTFQLLIYTAKWKDFDGGGKKEVLRLEFPHDLKHHVNAELSNINLKVLKKVLRFLFLENL